MADLSRSHILVTGLPGSGKTTVSEILADVLHRPLIGKDEIRDILFDHLRGYRDDPVDRSRIGSAAIAIQYYLMERIPPAVIDSALWTARSEPEIVALGRPSVQVYCSCPFEVARRRVAERRRWDSATTVAEFERFRPLTEPLRLPFPLVVLETGRPVDPRRMSAQLAAAFIAR